METQVAPVLVWDCNDSWLARSPEAYAWAERNIPEPVKACIYRIEFYILDGPPSAVVYRYRRDEGKHLFRDPATGKAAEENPEHVMLEALPPQELWPESWNSGRNPGRTGRR